MRLIGFAARIDWVLPAMSEPYAGRRGAGRPQLQRIFTQPDLIAPPGDPDKCLVYATCSLGGITPA
jgi:hypothetical protein